LEREATTTARKSGRSESMPILKLQGVIDNLM
jgi:hypothetical protein